MRRFSGEVWSLCVLTLFLYFHKVFKHFRVRDYICIVLPLFKRFRNDIVLSAFFIDKDEYDRLVYLSENPEQPKQDDIEENTDVVNNKQPEILTMAQVAIELQNIKADVANLQSSAPLNDDATVKFYETLSDSSTNSIAKIRAAAQQYLDDTATYKEVM